MDEPFVYRTVVPVDAYYSHAFHGKLFQVRMNYESVSGRKMRFGCEFVWEGLAWYGVQFEGCDPATGRAWGESLQDLALWFRRRAGLPISWKLASAWEMWRSRREG